ncbi:MAG: hypothetical protein AVDCRST_MAG26-1578, partial [uncultured Chloroflexia bacterium]
MTAWASRVAPAYRIKTSVPATIRMLPATDFQVSGSPR